MSELIVMFLLLVLAAGLTAAWAQAVQDKKLACARLEAQLADVRAENQRLKARLSTRQFTREDVT